MQGPIIWFDKFVNFSVGWWYRLWSHFGGKKNETISSTLGAEEAEQLYLLWIAKVPFEKIKDLEIPPEHIIGEFSSDLCDLFQRWHALRSIDWRKEKILKQKYPGIEEVVEQFLKEKLK